MQLVRPLGGGDDLAAVVLFAGAAGDKALFLQLFQKLGHRRMRDVRRRLQRLLRYLTRALALQTAKLAEHADLRAGQARFTHVFIHLPAYGFLQDRKAQSLRHGVLTHSFSPQK